MKKQHKYFTICFIIFTAAITLQSCSKKKSEKELEEIKTQNNKLFNETTDHFLQANNISTNFLPNLKGEELEIKEKEMITNLIAGIKSANKIDTNYLKSLHPELPEYFNKRLLISQKMYLDYCLKIINGESINDVNSYINKFQMLQMEWNYFWLKNRISIINNMEKNIKPKIEKSYWGMFWKFSLCFIVVTILFSFYMIFAALPTALFFFLSEKVDLKILKYILM